MALYVIGDLHLSENASKPMDVFGGKWQDYRHKIISNWNVTVKNDDAVILAGDISWGMNLREALADFKLIENLPGQKVILKGNHDYWWETVSKMKRFFKDNSIKTIDFIYNNCYIYGNYAICGTRGWTNETGGRSEDDERIIKREVGRLERSLKDAPESKEKIVVMHYPPIFEEYAAMEFIDVMREYDVKRCFYGHIHSHSIKKAVVGEHFGINFCLVSADAIDFLPVSI